MPACRATTVAAWLASDDAVTGDYRRDAENFSRQWRIGAELLAKLPPKPARSQAAGRGRRRDPGARPRGARKLSRRPCRDDLSPPDRAILPSSSASKIWSAMPRRCCRAWCRTRRCLPKRMPCSSSTKTAPRSIRVFFSRTSSRILPRGMHLCHAMLLPRPEAAGAGPSFRRARNTRARRRDARTPRQGSARHHAQSALPQCRG